MHVALKRVAVARKLWGKAHGEETTERGYPLSTVIGVEARILCPL
jgi:hypothetical protein